MKIFDDRWLMAGIVKEMRRRALLGISNGIANQNNNRYLENCAGRHLKSGTVMIFSRDCGMHQSGWLKNPDYDRCFHLSLSFFDPETEEPADKDPKLTDEWLNLFFQDNKRLLWIEPPHYSAGKIKDVWHYRLMCNEMWQPILPRKEVYSKDFTPAGWKSWSDVQAEKELDVR
ncbi:hypothetical protein FD723_40080 (plasmid) [Nostoc sp. C052]|uniref:hypothetical protein n=1 Tax=Nostoc sp. C052 TaxID=2576902 RepID=UPI0015C31EE3|nr:hypothetical protein [Nostoc sp. C052]QLE46413.1 hypothetical protein FD723_40080 [Nostoc sp. C052]